MVKRVRQGEIVEPSIKFLNESQEAAWNSIEGNTVTFLLGPAGCAKTYIATAYAAVNCKAERYDRMVVTRPIVEAGENLGFLPGSIQEKIDPYMKPVTDTLKKIGIIVPKMECIPLAYLRGVTFDNAICLLDEAQNCTLKQLKLYLSRIGRNSKIIVSGDTKQSDIGRSELDNVAASLEGMAGVSVYRFGDKDIVRNKLIGEMMKRIETMEESRTQKKI
jgi:phosphate starvation-inducible protein PhoH and related proteins